ncbi:MAG: glycosyltransferase family 4 protein [Bacteroidales bacterium]|nr:glycosyltransferase family 4 protein [Bacteroidales bacterium]
MKTKHLWIINEYAGTPYHGMEFRHYYMAKHLLPLGITTTIITASHSHLFHHKPVVKSCFTFQNIDHIHYVWVKVPSYRHSYSFRRVIKWFVFTIKLFFLPVRKLTKPDYIILSPMQTMPILPALYLRKKMKCPLAFEVKDIWPLSIVELGNFSPNNPFIIWLSWLEKLALEKCNPIISVLPAYQTYLDEKKISKKFVYIPNGVEINENTDLLDLPAKIKHLVPSGKFIVMYTGTLGIANALESFIEAAEVFRDHTDIFFVIVGDGPEKERLMNLAKGNPNIIFTGFIEKKYIPALLNLAHVAYIGLRKKRVFYYGVSPNKLFDYMIARKSILFAIDTSISLVDLAQCGFTVSAENPHEIADAVRKFYSMDKEDFLQMGNNAYRFVCEHHNYKVLSLKLKKTLFEDF